MADPEFVARIRQQSADLRYAGDLEPVASKN
jgi:hypothetical protein